MDVLHQTRSRYLDRKLASAELGLFSWTPSCDGWLRMQHSCRLLRILDWAAIANLQLFTVLRTAKHSLPAPAGEKHGFLSHTITSREATLLTLLQPFVKLREVATGQVILRQWRSVSATLRLSLGCLMSKKRAGKQQRPGKKLSVGRATPTSNRLIRDHAIPKSDRDCDKEEKLIGATPQEQGTRDKFRIHIPAAGEALVEALAACTQQQESMLVCRIMVGTPDDAVGILRPLQSTFTGYFGCRRDVHSRCPYLA